jgi:DNA-binding MarR family transcriptional regulator
MSRPFTLLEDLCQHALSMGAEGVEVEYQDGREWVYARKGDTGVSFASFPSSGVDAKELRDNLHRARKKPLKTILAGQAYILKVRIAEEFGEEVFTVDIMRPPRADPAAASEFTKTQGQYLAFIHNYTEINGCSPAGTDFQGYFQVSAPSVHETIKTLQRNGLIERIPGQARSIRLLVQGRQFSAINMSASNLILFAMGLTRASS